MRQYIFNDGRVRLMKDRFELCKISLGFMFCTNFERTFNEETIRYNEIDDVIVRQATLLRKGYVQIIRKDSGDKPIKEYYQCRNNKYVLVIANKKMNKQAMQVKNLLLSTNGNDMNQEAIQE